jgi:hypothetical protein
MIAMLSFPLGAVDLFLPSTHCGIMENVAAVAAAVLPINRRLEIFAFFGFSVL